MNSHNPSPVISKGEEIPFPPIMPLSETALLLSSQKIYRKISLLPVTDSLVLPTSPPNQTHNLDQASIGLVCDRNPVPMWVYDEDSKRFLYVNHAAIARYGYSREEMLTMTIFDIRGPEERLRLSLLLNTELPYKEGSSGYWLHQTRDGQHVWVEKFSQRILYEGCQARLITAPEVTQQVKGWEAQNEYLAALQISEQQARESAENLTLVLEEMSDAFFVLDEEGQFTYVNRNVETFFRRNRNELIGKNIWSEFPAIKQSLLFPHYQQLLHDNDAQHFEEYVASIDTWFEIHMYPLTRGISPANWGQTPPPSLEEERHTGLSVFFRDITARKEAEAANERASQERALVSWQQRHFLREVLFSVTEGSLHLCDSPDDLPRPLAEQWCSPILLTETEHLAQIRQQVREAMTALSFPPERIYDMVSAVSEGAMNALQHGNPARFPARVAIQTAPDQSEVQVWVTDYGSGIQLNELPRATLLRGHSTGGTLGHGFHLMLQSVDTIHLLTGPEGTTLVLRKYREERSFDALIAFSSKPSDKK